jgi:hypothetical protein
LEDPAAFVERQRRQRCYWEERPEGIYWTETWFDPVTCVSHGVFRFTDNDGVTHVWDDHERVRLYTLPELRRMFRRAGLTIRAVYGDFLLPDQQYGPDTYHKMIVVGQRSGG